jgi:hypothetical protein
MEARRRASDGYHEDAASERFCGAIGERRKLVATVKDVARWMQSEMERKGDLYQADAARDIESEFGKEFVYENERGNLAIDRRVLRAFRRLTEDTVVWMRWGRCWVKRGEHDPPGRQAY